MKLEALAYYSFVCGLLAIVAPILSSLIPRLIFGATLGIIATTSWPAIQVIFVH